MFPLMFYCRVSGVLRDTLGITALDDFMDWLGYNFDWDKVKETQQVNNHFVYSYYAQDSI